jgi:hypothetical protein
MPYSNGRRPQRPPFCARGMKKHSPSPAIGARSHTAAAAASPTRRHLTRALLPPPRLCAAADASPTHRCLRLTHVPLSPLPPSRIRTAPSSRACCLCARTEPPKFEGLVISLRPISFRPMCISPKPRIKTLNSVPYQLSRS